MIKTQLNYGSLVIRLIILLVLFLLLKTLIGSADNSGSSVVGLVLVIVPFFLVTASFCGVMKVEIDKGIDQITVSGIFYHTTFTTGNITGYYQSIERSRRRNFNGLILLLDNGKSYEVIEYNIRSVSEVEQYLQDRKIPFLGKKQSWFPLWKRHK